MTPRTPYPSDLSDAQWELVAPMIPPARRGGRPRATDVREALNAILYVVRTGCQWDALPHEFPSKSTVFEYFTQWRKDGVLEKIHETLRRRVRRQAGRDPEPSRVILDSQSVKTTDVGGEKEGIRRGQEGEGPQTPHRRRRVGDAGRT